MRQPHRTKSRHLPWSDGGGLLFLLSTFVDWAFASSLDAETIPEFLSRSYLLVASDTVEIVEVILAVNVVRGVNARLEDQASHPHQSAQQ